MKKGLISFVNQYYHSLGKSKMNRKDITDPKVIRALEVLDTLNPTNLHLKTNATYSHRADFDSVWYRHSPQAARYGLLPFYWRGELIVIEKDYESLRNLKAESCA